MEFSISACNRAPRKGEIDGKDYYFLSTDQFRDKIKADQFIEWEEVYPGNFYGTLKSELNRIWNNGNHVLFDIDVKGGVHLKKLYPKNSLSVFVMPPSIEALESRLQNRSTDDLETIRKRLAKAEQEMLFANQFDVILINDDLSLAKEKALQLLTKFILESNEK